MKKYSWYPDELILLLDVFFRFLPDIIEGNSNNNLDSELILLSERLRSINLHSNDFTANPKFRNVNGMKMMIQNLRYIYHVENEIFPYKGLRQHPKYFVYYFRKYYEDIEIFNQDLKLVLKKYKLV